MLANKEYDLTGLKCPMPIVELNRIMKELAPGQACIVTADDIAFCPDVEAWCRRTGHELVTCDSEQGKTVAVVRKSA